MDQTPETLWQAFEALADTYPHDDGVRLTAHLTRWLIDERRRVQVPVPPVLDTVVPRVVKVIEMAGGGSPEHHAPTKGQ